MDAKKILDAQTANELPEFVSIEIPALLYCKAAVFRGQSETIEEYIETRLEYGIKNLI